MIGRTLQNYFLMVVLTRGHWYWCQSINGQEESWNHTCSTCPASRRYHSNPYNYPLSNSKNFVSIFNKVTKQKWPRYSVWRLLIKEKESRVLGWTCDIGERLKWKTKGKIKERAWVCVCIDYMHEHKYVFEAAWHWSFSLKIYVNLFRLRERSHPSSTDSLCWGWEPQDPRRLISQPFSQSHS